MNDGRIAVPCKGCSDRTLLCHDSCPRYAEFRSELQRHKALVAKAKAESRLGYVPRPEGRRRG